MKSIKLKKRNVVILSLFTLGVVYAVVWRREINTLSQLSDHNNLRKSAEEKVVKRNNEHDGESLNQVSLISIANEQPESNVVVTELELNVIGKRCVRNITIYSRNLNADWPAYVELYRALFRSRLPSSPHYRKDVYQHPEYRTAYVECPEQPCDMVVTGTDDYDFIAGSDAVVINMKPPIHLAGTHKLQRQLQNSTSKVKTIFYSAESALTTVNYFDEGLGNLYYHFMMTYNYDSDIYFPYGKYIPDKPLDETEIDHSKNKTGMIVWVASNCDKTFWPRHDWVKRLQRVMPVDVYGKCGNLSCLPKLAEHCRSRMASYKFYLALESGECEDYITEKFWSNGLVHGLVPVAYGATRASYERVAPPGSFIHISDFSSVKQLADYLHVLDHDNVRYNRFFAWRREGRLALNIPGPTLESFCQVLPSLSKKSSHQHDPKMVADSSFMNSCRAPLRRKFSKEGDITKWKPW